MKRKITFVICLLYGLLFINAGLNKLFNYIPPPDDLPEAMAKLGMAMAEIGWLFPLVAVAEIVGGLLFIIPKFRALGAVVLFPIVMGIVLTHLTAAPSGLPMAVVVLGVLLWILFENRKKYGAMIGE